ncbi:SigE family RNA polymerase sigma factor [Phytohabitans flavus]|uniref:RNA polymerase sigma24 factor n=1 Tax=Phytohabitans flavus TaxID=1076124 RepID=A0A6F8XWX1_9ACTN|nr:SigE family RNA polymerase sigma factor [Phytohabitans flavus]BCB78336.1 RNA polymerase sigma24 factor [Phytohabitans flavus]
MRSEDDRAYVEYLSARLPWLHRTAYLLCGDGDRADDVVQMTAIAMYAHWGKVREAENMDAYVHRMLFRSFLRVRRHAWSRVLLLNRLPDRPTGGDGHGVEERDNVLRALEQLPKGQRTVLVLRYFSDLSVEDTAAVLGCSTGTVKSQTTKALANLRNLIGSPDSLRSS